MKSNLQDISAFYAEVKRQQEAHKDYLVPAGNMRMANDDLVVIDEAGEFQINDLAHSQIAERLGIPKRYYDDIAAVPGLRTINVNELSRHQGKTSFVRTLDKNVRAVLSDRYKPLDNFPILTESILPVVSEFDGLKMLSNCLTEKRMYLQFVLPSLVAEVKPGDLVYYGVTITNSEVGLASLNIEELLYRLVCSNGAIGQSIIRKYHSGRRISTEGNYDIYSEETVLADAKAYQLQIRDILKHAMTETFLKKAIEPWKEAAGIKIEKPIETVQNVTKYFNNVIQDKESEIILQRLSVSGDMTKFGLANAVTNFAQEVNPDRAYELEKTGQKIIELSPSDWHQIAA